VTITNEVKWRRLSTRGPAARLGPYRDHRPWAIGRMAPEALALAERVVMATRRCVDRTLDHLELRLAARRSALDPDIALWVRDRKAGVLDGSVGRRLTTQPDLDKLLGERRAERL